MITLQATIIADIQKVWAYWTSPDHIVNWNFANEDWHCPSAENNLEAGGKFKYRMAAKDKSMAFDLEGSYKEVIEYEKIDGQLADDRKFLVEFTSNDGQTKVTQSFEPEKSNPEDMQRQGWQAILNNFKKYAESA